MGSVLRECEGRMCLSLSDIIEIVCAVSVRTAISSRPRSIHRLSFFRADGGLRIAPFVRFPFRTI